MTILVDTVFFQLGATGIARVWRSLLEQWSRTDFAERIVVCDSPRFDTLVAIPF